MTVKQISVFVENSAGKLAELTEYLNRHDIDMRALSIAETQDFGIVRMIVNDAYKASCVLKGGWLCSFHYTGSGSGDAGRAGKFIPDIKNIGGWLR